LEHKLAKTDERRFQISSGSPILYLSSAHPLTSFPLFLAQQKIKKLTDIRSIAITQQDNKKFPILEKDKRI